jgi:chlorite dismutase
MSFSLHNGTRSKKNNVKNAKNTTNKKNNTKRNNMTEEIILKSLSQKFDVLLSGFAELRQDIVGLKNDVSGLKNDVHGLKNDVHGLKRAVTTLQDDMRGVKKYIKLESTFQERENREFISKIYALNHPTNSIVTLHIQKIYTCAYKEITDLDGFLLISTFPIRAIQLPTELIASSKNPAVASFAASLKDNNTRNAKQAIMEYIIIESKHSLSKGKVDKKIRQMKEIHDMLSVVPIMDPTQCHPSYTSMIENIGQSTGLPLDKLNLPINLIFSSNDISYELCNYVCAIHDGISEEEYNELSLKLLYSDEYAHDILEEIYKDGTVLKKVKHDIKAALFTKDMKSIRSVFALLDSVKMHRDRIKYLQDYVTPFSELEPFFTEMKNKIGVAQFNTITFPRLFTKQTLNQ